MDKKIIIFIGPHGAGKTTLAKRILTPEQLDSFINVEEISIAQQIKKPSKSYRPGEIDINGEAIKRAIDYATKNHDFSLELIGAGQEEYDLVGRLKNEFGYKLIVHSLHLRSEKESVLRVAQRVRNGGHSIPIEVILKSFSQATAYSEYFTDLADENFFW